MMGYTHATPGAVLMAAFSGEGTQDYYVVAATVGAFEF